MLTDLEDDPLFLVVDAPNSTLVLEAGSSCPGGGMYAPLVGGGELLDSVSPDEGGEGLIEDGSCRTGPKWGPLSLERDRRGVIGDGLVGHEELVDKRERRLMRLIDTKGRTSL